MKVFDRATSPTGGEVTIEHLEVYTAIHGGVAGLAGIVALELFAWSPGGLLSVFASVTAFVSAFVMGVLAGLTVLKAAVFGRLYMIERQVQAQQQM